MTPLDPDSIAAVLSSLRAGVARHASVAALGPSRFLAPPVPLAQRDHVGDVRRLREHIAIARASGFDCPDAETIVHRYAAHERRAELLAALESSR